MNTAVEKKFAVEVIYNGVEKSLQVEAHESVAELLQKAIKEFHISQNPHLLSLFREDGSVVPENETIERAGIKPCEVLLLRPNAVKGGIGLVRVAGDILEKSFETFRECGRAECECAVFWTGPHDTDGVDGVEHPVHQRSPYGYEVNDRWLTGFWKRLVVSRQTIKAQVHTHPGAAFHSATDDRWPIVSQPDFLSIVIPDFAMGDVSLEGAWVGRLGEDGIWCPVTAEQAVRLA
jgi:hypothetical protein